MTYQETIDYLYCQRPAFERQGASGYKPGLQTTLDLAEQFGNPYRQYRIIHVAGTNGKGSVSHMLATMLQLNGYRVGLYTSPHFVDFRERIRVNGKMISQDEVVTFIEEFKQMRFDGSPSFFELTTILAMRYFANQHVDVAVLETGLGGRLDSTNIVKPILSVITNVSYDHTEFLGQTLPQIANEKAGIIKAGVPVVIGEAQEEVRRVFEQQAHKLEAPVTFAEDTPELIAIKHEADQLSVTTRRFGTFVCELEGNYQRHNINTALVAERLLEDMGFKFEPNLVSDSFCRITSSTGLMGRWMTIGNDPCRIICDSGHNIAGISSVMKQLRQLCYSRLHIVVGFMADKDLLHILPLLPVDAIYYFTQAQTARALKSHELHELAAQYGLTGQCYDDVKHALDAARDAAKEDDLIYVGGSMYVLAELLTAIQQN